MKQATNLRHIRATALAALMALALIATTRAAHAQVQRTGNEPWYQDSTPENREQANALFHQGVDKHLELLRDRAMELYERAVALWDNPDIRWNLALVLDDLGKYLSAHEQLERMLRWDAALGDDVLLQVRARMHALETQRLARIEVVSDQAGADVQLDGQSWFRGAGSQRMLVTPGTHYIAATKSGYTPTTVSMTAAAGEQYRVKLRMVPDHIIETRRWSAWKPWSVVAAGAAVAAVGAGVEWDARVHRADAARSLGQDCAMDFHCPPGRPPDNDRAVTENWIAVGAFAAGGTALAIGAVLAWLNQPRAHYAEPTPSPVELVPTVSPGGAALSARVRF